MKHARNAIAAVLLLTLAAMAGCESASQRWVALTITYTTAIEGAADLRQQGHIDDDEYNAIERVRVPVAAALDEAERYLLADDEDHANSTLDRAADLLDTLAQLLAQAEKEGQAP